MQKKIRLLIVDDHTILRQGLLDILRGYPDICVVAEAEDGSSMIVKYDMFNPDVVLTDIEMPVVSGLAAAKKIMQKDSNAKILFLSMHYTDEYIYKIDTTGGKGLVSKEIIKDELVNAIRTVADGERYFMGKTEEEVKAIRRRYDEILNKNDQEKSTLTRREKTVLTYIAKGLTSEQIAEKLHIGKRTVDTYRQGLMDKLNIDSLPQLIRYSIQFEQNGDIE